MPVKTVESLRRGLSLYEALHNNEPASLSDLARRTGLDKATALRALATLQEAGWITRRVNDGLYLTSGPATERTDRAELETLRRIGMPYVQELAARTGFAADLIAKLPLPGLEVVDSTRKKRPGGVDPKVAGFRPSYVFSSPGRAILAFCRDAERASILDYLLGADSPPMRFEITSGRLERELEATRRRGYGIRAAGYWPDSSDFGREPMDIAVPIYRPDGNILGAISLVWPTDAESADRVADMHLQALSVTAKSMSDALLSKAEGLG